MRADADDAIDNMTLIDSIYTAAGLPVRQPTSAFLKAGTQEAADQAAAGTKCGNKGRLGGK
jgi:hypothetical protein